jgi:hypothetical protein
MTIEGMIRRRPSKYCSYIDRNRRSIYVRQLILLASIAPWRIFISCLVFPTIKATWMGKMVIQTLHSRLKTEPSVLCQYSVQFLFNGIHWRIIRFRHLLMYSNIYVLTSNGFCQPFQWLICWTTSKDVEFIRPTYYFLAWNALRCHTVSPHRRIAFGIRHERGKNWSWLRKNIHSLFEHGGEIFPRVTQNEYFECIYSN